MGCLMNKVWSCLSMGILPKLMPEFCGVWGGVNLWICKAGVGRRRLRRHGIRTRWLAPVANAWRCRASNPRFERGTEFLQDTVSACSAQVHAVRDVETAVYGAIP